MHETIRVSMPAAAAAACTAEEQQLADLLVHWPGGVGAAGGDGGQPGRHDRLLQGGTRAHHSLNLDLQQQRQRQQQVQAGSFAVAAAAAAGVRQQSSSGPERCLPEPLEWLTLRQQQQPKLVVGTSLLGGAVSAECREEQ